MFLVLQVEAMISQGIGLKTCFFFTDCRSLANVAEAKNMKDNPRHWRIRPILADFFNFASDLNSHRVSHIPRSQNLLAHSLAIVGITLIIPWGCEGRGNLIYGSVRMGVRTRNYTCSDPLRWR